MAVLSGQHYFPFFSIPWLTKCCFSPVIYVDQIFGKNFLATTDDRNFRMLGEDPTKSPGTLNHNPGTVKTYISTNYATVFLNLI